MMALYHRQQIFLTAVCILLSVSASLGQSNKNRLIFILVDGLRSDAVNEIAVNGSNGFSEIAANGVQSDYLTPVFPSLGFPNFVSLLTGLNPENHGVTDDFLFDYDSKTTFIKGQNYDKFGNETNNSGFKFGVESAYWNVADKMGRKILLVDWPGCGVLIQPRERCRSYADDFNSSLVQVLREMQTMDLGMIFVRLNSVALEGEIHGPQSDQYRNATSTVAMEIGELYETMKEQNLHENTNLLVVSPHGMKTVAKSAMMIDISRFAASVQTAVTPPEGGSQVSIYPKHSLFLKLFNPLYRRYHRHVRIYWKYNMPEAWHVRGGKYVAPILVVADPGWIVVTSRHQAAFHAKHRRGYSGYDPKRSKEMRGVFLATGPSFKQGSRAGPLHVVDVYNLLCKITDLAPAPNNGSAEALSSMLLAANETRKPLTTPGTQTSTKMAKHPRPLTLNETFESRVQQSSNNSQIPSKPEGEVGFSNATNEVPLQNSTLPNESGFNVTGLYVLRVPDESSGPAVRVETELPAEVKGLIEILTNETLLASVQTFSADPGQHQNESGNLSVTQSVSPTMTTQDVVPVAVKPEDAVVRVESTLSPEVINLLDLLSNVTLLLASTKESIQTATLDPFHLKGDQGNSSQLAGLISDSSNSTRITNESLPQEDIMIILDAPHLANGSTVIGSQANISQEPNATAVPSGSVQKKSEEVTKPAAKIVDGVGKTAVSKKPKPETFAANSSDDRSHSVLLKPDDNPDNSSQLERLVSEKANLSLGINKSLPREKGEKLLAAVRFANDTRGLNDNQYELAGEANLTAEPASGHDRIRGNDTKPADIGNETGPGQVAGPGEANETFVEAEGDDIRSFAQPPKNDSIPATSVASATTTSVKVSLAGAAERVLHEYGQWGGYSPPQLPKLFESTRTIAADQQLPANLTDADQLPLTNETDLANVSVNNRSPYTPPQTLRPRGSIGEAGHSAAELAVGLFEASDSAGQIAVDDKQNETDSKQVLLANDTVLVDSSSKGVNEFQLAEADNNTESPPTVVKGKTSSEQESPRRPLNSTIVLVLVNKTVVDVTDELINELITIDGSVVTQQGNDTANDENDFSTTGLLAANETVYDVTKEEILSKLLELRADAIVIEKNRTRSIQGLNDNENQTLSQKSNNTRNLSEVSPENVTSEALSTMPSTTEKYGNAAEPVPGDTIRPDEKQSANSADIFLENVTDDLAAQNVSARRPLPNPVISHVLSNDNKLESSIPTYRETNDTVDFNATEEVHPTDKVLFEDSINAAENVTKTRNVSFVRPTNSSSLNEPHGRANETEYLNGTTAGEASFHQPNVAVEAKKQADSLRTIASNADDVDKRNLTIAENATNDSTNNSQSTRTVHDDPKRNIDAAQFVGESEANADDIGTANVSRTENVTRIIRKRNIVGTKAEGEAYYDLAEAAADDEENPVNSWWEDALDALFGYPLGQSSTSQGNLPKPQQITPQNADQLPKVSANVSPPQDDEASFAKNAAAGNEAQTKSEESGKLSANAVMNVNEQYNQRFSAGNGAGGSGIQVVLNKPEISLLYVAGQPPKYLTKLSKGKHTSTTITTQTPATTSATVKQDVQASTVQSPRSPKSSAGASHNGTNESPLGIAIIANSIKP